MMHPISAVDRIARSAFLSLARAALRLTACADYKTPAKETLAKVEASLNNVARDAAKYTPTELKAVQADLAAAKAKFDDGDYEQALIGARGVAAAVPKLATNAGQKRIEFMKQLADDWQKM